MKLTSPYLHKLIIVGVIMLYVYVILFGIDEGTPASRCSVNAKHELGQDDNSCPLMCRF